jgi:hypothetical protein
VVIAIRKEPVASQLLPAKAASLLFQFSLQQGRLLLERTASGRLTLNPKGSFLIHHRRGLALAGV